MRVHQLHPWDISIEEAKALQHRLASRASRTGQVSQVKHVMGVDISAPDEAGRAKGAAVVVAFPDLQPVEQSVVEETVKFPYVPGLLSFRESPLIIRAIERLSIQPDLLLVDGHGMAHPRRFGIACHLGLLLDLPTIGCAKSRLCGTYWEPGQERGSSTDLIDQEEVIGAVVRTRPNTNPIFVSIGHKVDLKAAVKWMLRCCGSYRMPEPTRLAHLAAAGRLNIPSPVRIETTEQIRLF